jgi:hypothetical protein
MSNLDLPWFEFYSSVATTLKVACSEAPEDVHDKATHHLHDNLLAGEAEAVVQYEN